MTCGDCGKAWPARKFWHRIEPITDPNLAELDAAERLAEVPTTEVPTASAMPGCEAGELIEAWASDLRARACRPKSIKAMTSTIRTFASRISARDLASVTRDQIIEFLGTDGWAPLTRRTYRTTVATFYDWMTLTGRVAVNPAGRLPRTRVPHTEPNPLSTAQIEQLLNSGVRQRTRMMIMLAAYQGLRASEVAVVHGRDVVDGMLHIPDGKGGTSLWRPLHPVIAELSARFPADDYWFPGNNGNAHVTGPSVSMTISAALRRAGIHGHRPHQLRAWHATEMVRAGVDAVTVQHSMRHATLGTLHKYVHPDAADVAQALSRLPRITGPDSSADPRGR